MTAELLAALRDYLTTELVTTEKLLAAVLVVDNFTEDTMLKVNHFPAALIKDMTSRRTPGPFGNTQRVTYRIAIRIIGRSTNALAYIVAPTSGTAGQSPVSVIVETMRLKLYENKKITDETFEMNRTWDESAIAKFNSTKNGHFTIKDNFIEYTKIEYDTGMQNNQNHLTPAYQF